MRLAVLALVLAACTDAPAVDFVMPDQHPLPLADLPELSAYITYGLVEDGVVGSPRLRRLDVTINYDPEHAGNGLQDSSMRWFCPQLTSSFAMTFGGLDAEITDPGHWRGPVADSYRCMPPSAAIVIPDDVHLADAQLVLGDDSFSLTVPLGDVLQPRMLELPGGAAWRFQKDQTVTVTWSPLADLAAMPDTRIDLINTDGIRAFAIDKDITRGSDTLGFTLPGVTGNGTLYIHLLGPEISAPHYTLSVSQAAFHDVEITP